MATLESLAFDNGFARLPETYYSRVCPTPVPDPYLVCYSPEALALLDLDAAEIKRRETIETLAGNRLLPGMEALAALYAGHQFGHYVPQLGDGRAILLGEVKNAAGEGWEMQLKGAGRTPYSRGGDGRAVLRSSIREFLCSEAMHALGIPTTRALAIVGSDHPVYREDEETAALVTRLAPSFVRFGSFEVFYYRNQVESIKHLADYVIARYYPELKDLADPYPEFLRQVSLRTADLMAQWQAVGFSHGVMNTDNMSILGLTLDYGPFGFLDAFDPGFVCNHSDTGGRYAFDQQPDVAAWNLTKLAQALVPLMSVEAASQAIGEYPQAFGRAYLERMAAKFGLAPGEDTVSLIMDALQLLAQNRVDYTILMRRLCAFDSTTGAINAPLRDLFLDRTAFDAWAARYAAALRQQGSGDAERGAAMRRLNPKYILRNHLAEIAIRQAADHRDYSEVDRLHRLLARPFDEQPAFESYAAEPPDWARKIEVSCSS
ncbi:protein adenylyltransferase SelO [Thiobacillus sedimenti]|uniref:Protein nucleotidyltransferase YdiU n=1 Tax=Thiobacillus sedimenti TaxID=3110231 RepID=A0ABZ1CFP8_9PROT|nr:YdiU family protein [Thiobacillus sp. SCUT-2]WRS37999.1 YdiU family protein [Thiobacillus sp. SCUT-2]